jgi:hypothetical protein
MLKTVSRIVLAAGVLASLTFGIGNGTVQAQGAFPAYTSGVQVANLEGTDAQVTLTAYKSDGNQDGTPLQDTITANGSKTYFPISSVSNGFQGAIVISSSRRIAAISNILSSDFNAGASYVGSAAGNQTVLLPLLNKGNSGFDTWFSVQNAGTGTATIDIAYSSGLNIQDRQIPMGAAIVFYQKNEDHGTARVFAGTITSDQPVVAAVIQETRNATSGAGIIFSYTGFTGGTTNPVFPLINANNSGYQTGLQIQNAGTQATEVTVSYTPTPNNGTACTETQTIAPGASATYALAAFHPSAPAPGTANCAKGAKFIGSAQVTGNSTSQPLVGIGNQLLAGVNGEAYGAFDANAATNKVVMPLIMDRRGGANKFYTGFNLQNVGTGTATVSCTFVGDDFTIAATALAPGEALNNIQRNQIADNYAGGATCTAAEAGAKIVAIVNELGDRSTADQLLVYEGAISQ